MQRRKEWVSKCLVHSDALLMVEKKHLADEVDPVNIRPLEELGEVLALSLGQAVHEFFVVGLDNLVNHSLLAVAEQVVDFFHLFVLALSGQQRLARIELSQDTPDRPDIDGARVLLLREDDFGGAVPARGDVVGELRRRGHEVGDVGAGEAEIADFQVAVAVNQQVARFQVPVQDTCGVQVLQAAEDLIGEESDVLFGEGLVRLDNLGQIGLHQVSNHIKIVEFVGVFWTKNALQT